MRRIVGEPLLWALVDAGCMLSAATGLPAAGSPEPVGQTTPGGRHVHQWGCTDCDGAEQLSAIRALFVMPCSFDAAGVLGRQRNEDAH